MIQVQFPEGGFKTRELNGKRYIFDAIRRSWLLLTPEEWVRQNFINYLIVSLKYPAAFMALEKVITLNGLKKRFDVLVFNGQHQPWMMVECKAPEVALNEGVLQQLLRYNISVPVELMIITNGAATMGWKKENGSLKLLMSLPRWQ